MLDVKHDGVGMSSLGACPTKRPPIPTPDLRTEFITIQGRDGQLTVPDAYDNITFVVEYNILEEENIKPLMRRIKGFLIGKTKLEFSDDDVYYKIKKALVLDTDNEIEEYGLFTVEYTCDPFQYSAESEYQVVLNGGVIENLGTIDSAPLIKVIGTGSGMLSINGQEVQFIDLDGEIMLDSELKNAYTGSELSVESSRNRNVRGMIPTLQVGENVISFSGGVTRVEINGRWRYV